MSAGAFRNALESPEVKDALAYVERTQLAALRDLFAVHAPDVPEWFQPRLSLRQPTAPARPPSLSERAEFGRAQIEMGEGFDVDLALSLNVISQADRDLLVQFAEQCQRWRKALAEWVLACRPERLIQWRWHYADLMLAGREPRP